MNTSDLIEKLVADQGLTKVQSKAIVDSVLKGITDSVVAGDEVSLRSAIRELRALGHVVVQRLPGESDSADPGDFIFDRELHCRDSKWQVIDREVATNAK